MRRFYVPRLIGGCATLALLLWAGSLQGQMTQRTGGATSGGTGGGTGMAGGGGTGLGGSNFLQSPTNFLGNTGTTTGTGAGSTRNFGGGGGTGGTGSASSNGSAFQGISSSNVLGSYFANPQAMGTGTGNTGTIGTAKTRFGAPLNNIATQTLSAGTGASGFNRGGTATLSSSSAYPGSSNIGVRRAPAYSTTLGFDYQPPAMNAVHPQIRAAIADSTRLPSKDSMVVAMDGETVVLRGTAGSERERRLAEALIRLTPGVHDVRNDLEVREGAPAPRPIP